MTDPSWDDMLVIGRIARAHGLRGQVVVAPETDFPEERFRQGAEMFINRGAGPERLVVRTARIQPGRPILGFEGVESVEAADALGRGDLRVPEESLGPLPEGVFHHHALVGCEVRTTRGEPVGAVSRVEGSMASSLLVVDGPRGEVLVPFVGAICVEVEPAARRIVIDPPEGLIEANVGPHRPGEPRR
jgi:16S rRNA processing protein RimM